MTVISVLPADPPFPGLMLWVAVWKRSRLQELRLQPKGQPRSDFSDDPGSLEADPLLVGSSHEALLPRPGQHLDSMGPTAVLSQGPSELQTHRHPEVTVV